MLHACVQRFDVMGNLEKFCKILGTKHHLTLPFGLWSHSFLGTLKEGMQKGPMIYSTE